MSSSPLQPMLANALDIADIDKKARGYWMEPKLDGIRCVAAWDGRMYSRSAKTALHLLLPHLSTRVIDLDLPQGVWLDGEVGYLDQERPVQDGWPILDFNATVRVTGSSPDEALRKQNARYGFNNTIRFFVFDIIDPAEHSQAARSWMLNEYLQKRTDYLIEMVPQLGAWDEARYDDYVLMGGEGVILKNPSALYQRGKRPAKHWYKIKKFDSFDGLIVGQGEGQGKYEDLLGYLMVEHPDGKIIRASGMTDAQRLDMTRQWTQKYFRKHVEVKYFGLTAGTPRHPQFLRMRPDLD